MNVFINFDLHTTLDLFQFHPRQWLQNRSNIKEKETSKVAMKQQNDSKMTNVESELSSMD